MASDSSLHYTCHCPVILHKDNKFEMFRTKWLDLYDKKCATRHVRALGFFLSLVIVVQSSENFSCDGDCQGKRETFFPWEDKVFLLKEKMETGSGKKGKRRKFGSSV